MSRKKLTVHKEAYEREAYTRRKDHKLIHVKPAHVPATIFKIRDVGAMGRGKRLVPPLKRGSLGGKGFFEKSKETQLRIARHVAHTKGEKIAVGKLRALQVFFKRTNPEYSQRAYELSHEIAGEFRGTKRVRYPSGFKRRQLSEMA